ncbi:hypothetical protein EXN66_Car017941 [Channa argus]|uniref:Uncharacterized protein n=1 Tax=Channa argus TaxID=215402 RepID=A0A6G1QIW2_CHAAH|nr:hypothetical protein EXN66_Car017941 [Channa argus]KAK2888497.1 hypothetical protein Q8A73_019945 [Channa argus]
MAEAQPPIIEQTVANTAPQGHPPQCTPHPEGKMLEIENALLLANQNHAQLQRQMEILQQENQKLKIERAKLLPSAKDAEAAPQGFPYCYGSATSVEEELHNLRNAAIIAYRQNIHLRSQLESLMKQNQQLQAQNTEANKMIQHYEEHAQVKTDILQQNEQLKVANANILQQNNFLKSQNIKIYERANAERTNYCSLEGRLKDREKEFSIQQQELQSQINHLTEHLEMMQKESILRESTFKDKHEKTATLLNQEKNKVTQQQMQIAKASFNQRNIDKIDKLMVQLSQKDEEILQLKNQVQVLQSDSQKLCEIKQQLENKEAENSFIIEEWQTKCDSLQEQLKKQLSEKKQSWETRFKQVEEEKIGLQHDNKRSNQQSLEQRLNKLLEENTEFQQKNTQVKEEKTKLVDDITKMEKETTQLLQDKINLQQEKEELEELCHELQKKLKKRGFWTRL